MIVWRKTLHLGDMMKLPIKKEYFDAIKAGVKKKDFRDAHITFICPETGEVITKKIKRVEVIKKEDLPNELKDSDMFDDEDILGFVFKD